MDGFLERPLEGLADLLGELLREWDTVGQYEESRLLLMHMWDFLERQSALLARIGFTVCDISGDGNIDALDAKTVSQIAHILFGKGRKLRPRRDLFKLLPELVFNLLDCTGDGFISCTFSHPVRETTRSRSRAMLQMKRRFDYYIFKVTDFSCATVV